ncbi:type VI secretion system baseplate subunit TssE [Nannocystis pusilla]|uniref:Type VI secretion system baseplate subunit TssE n=1 Tax=Nannocystis pusilla TaxID=889268 RepID=A0A9X3EZ98_9BACT|nr:type VI secretion system baseplate subunit TssE [Nannocystis pusilla]MCY1013082.1 type VI secretion system baseplate subunit TssE [Nannocystis pusilla]
MSSGSTSREYTSRGLLGRLGQAGPRPGAPERILAHLQALLGTRRGESLSAPGMGLTDFADIMHGYPASMQVLVHAIRTMLSQYEPRLRAITVTPAASDDPLTLALEITAKLDDAGGAVHMRTELTASGRIHVSGG